MSRQLQPRDYTLARLLAEHDVLTAAQITALLFGSAHTALHRLRRLAGLGWVASFSHRPRRTSPRTPTHQACWVAGPLAARYSALADGQTPPTPRAVRILQDRLLANPQLDHHLGVNQFFTDLVAHARAHPDTRLARWWSSSRTTAALAGRIHPDGHGVWQVHRSGPGALDTPVDTGDHGVDDDDDRGGAGGGGGEDGAGWADARCGYGSSAAVTTTGSASEAAGDGDSGTWGLMQVGFWLEYDTGSEPLHRLSAKLTAYARLQRAGGGVFPVLFWLPSARRERHLHQLLATSPPPPGVIVATGLHDAPAGPAGPSWWLVAGHDARVGHGPRVSLADLPSAAVPYGPLNPGLVPEDDPLH